MLLDEERACCVAASLEVVRILKSNIKEMKRGREEGGREGGREGEREREREGGREGGWEDGRERSREERARECTPQGKKNMRHKGMRHKGMRRSTAAPSLALLQPTTTLNICNNLLN